MYMHAFPMLSVPNADCTHAHIDLKKAYRERSPLLTLHLSDLWTCVQSLAYLCVDLSHHQEFCQWLLRQQSKI